MDGADDAIPFLVAKVHHAETHCLRKLNLPASQDCLRLWENVHTMCIMCVMWHPSKPQKQEWHRPYNESFWTFLKNFRCKYVGMRLMRFNDAIGITGIISAKFGKPTDLLITSNYILQEQTMRLLGQNQLGGVIGDAIPSITSWWFVHRACTVVDLAVPCRGLTGQGLVVKNDGRTPGNLLVGIYITLITLH